MRMLLFTLLSFFYYDIDHRAAGENYIEKYKDLAIVEMKRSGIPASIKLAQAILESNNGNSEFAQKTNNHFGIKCKEYWRGGKYFHKDDDKNGRGELIKSCFRAYNEVSDSYTDHSNFLRASITYEPLFRIGKNNYHQWAAGLEALGYATDDRYSEKLISIIERYQLFIYDRL